MVSQGTDEDAVSVSSLELCGEENGKTGDKTLLNLYDDICFKRNADLGTTPSENAGKIIKHIRSLSDVTDFTVNSNNDRANENSSTVDDVSDHPPGTSNNHTGKNQTSGSYALDVNIIETGDLSLWIYSFTVALRYRLNKTTHFTGIVCEKGKTFGIYAIEVNRKYETGYSEEWHIYRRYSDFYDLHSKVKDKVIAAYLRNATATKPNCFQFSDLSKLVFPGKKTFHNMDRPVLERRMRMLGTYMNQLCNEEVIRAHYGLRELLMTFLEQGEYDRATSGGPIMNTVSFFSSVPFQKSHFVNAKCSRVKFKEAHFFIVRNNIEVLFICLCNKNYCMEMCFCGYVFRP